MAQPPDKPSESIQIPTIRDNRGVIKPVHTKETHTPLPKLEIARVVNVGQISYQPIGDSATILPIRSTQWFSKAEQPYKRVLKATPDWQPLDIGWITPTECGLMILENRARYEGVRLPNKETDVLNSQNTIEISFRQVPLNFPDLVIPPGVSQSLQPMNLDKIRFRCRKPEGSVPCVLHLFSA